MMREQKSKRIFVHIGLVMVLSICAILVFLFSIKGLLLSESKQRLAELNENSEKILQKYLDANSMDEHTDPVVFEDNNTRNYFSGQVYSYILNDTDTVAGMYGNDANDVLSRNDNNLGNYLKGQNKIVFRQRLIQDGCQVFQYELPEGEAVYAAISQTNLLANGLIVTLVSKKLVMSEINSVYNIAIVIVILALVALVLALIYNVYKQRSAVRKMKKSDKPDSVTGLVQYSIHKAIAQKNINAEKNKYAYVAFSIDKYTLISELNGKSYCDFLLKGVAKNVSGLILEEETFARINEDIFGMLLIYEDELKFRQRLLRILKHASDIPLIENNFCNITFHSGVCVVGKETDIDRVIAKAQKARVGVGARTFANINFYQNKTNMAAENSKITQEVLAAINNNEFLVYFQPKYRINSEEIVGAEALVRWNHPKNGVLSPGIFLPLLEENGMITQIDMHVLEKVCVSMKSWIEQKKKVVPVSVNLSAQHLDDPSFLKQLIHIVDCNHVPHQLIEFEFPECAVFEKQKKLTEVMKQLSALGFILSVDNFGVGPSAIHLLNQLPIQMIKIDKGLIKDLEDADFSDKDRTIVMHIISYAKKNNVEVVAEGVETKGQRDLLLAQQCDIIQGFYYEKPMPPNEFEKLI